MSVSKNFKLLVSGLLLSGAVPAFANVKDGVDAWARGDYKNAVKEWRDLSEKGDPDAQFNMAQAYRLGRGVDEDLKLAETLYKKAADQNHVKAADNYGLLLFQGGRQQESIPYITAASDRGDPRAQYLMGIAHFNGELVEKDWVKAYALLTLANSAGLPQAAPALAQMDGYIPLGDRQQAQLMAQSLRNEANAKRGQQMAAFDLAMGKRPPSGPAAAGSNSDLVSASGPAAAYYPAQAPRAPGPVASPASTADAIAQAESVTGTENPAEAGADFVQPAPTHETVAQPEPTENASLAMPSRPKPGRKPVVVQQSNPRTRAEAAKLDKAPKPASSVAKAPTRKPAAAAARPVVAAASGSWKVQLGAFSVRANADKLWSSLAGNSALSGRKKIVVAAGGTTKLMAGGYATKADAQAACNKLKAAGASCLITQ